MYLYKVVRGASSSELEEKVNRMLFEGWRLQGGIVVTCAGGIEIWAQVMVKK